MNRNVVDKSFILTSLFKDVPKGSGLNVITSLFRSSPVEVGSSTDPLFVRVLEGNLLVGNSLERRGVVGESTAIAIDSKGTVTLEGSESVERAVDRNLLVVGTQTVALSIGVRKETRLENRVGRRLNTGNSVRRRKGSLLNVGIVVLGVLVQNELTKTSQGVVLVRPNLGQVENGEGSRLGLLGGHGLDVDSPRWVVTLLDGFKQVALDIVGVLTSKLASLLVVQGLDTLVRNEVDLDVDKRAVLLDPLVSVTGVTVHVTVTGRSTTVGEELQKLVSSLGVVCEVVPEHVSILQVSFWVSLLGVDENGELGWVSDEKDGGVVVDPVGVTFLSVELGGETTGISGSVGRTLLATNGGKSGKGSGALANLAEEVGAGQVRNVVSDLKVTEGTGTLGVDDTLGDSLAVKVGEQVNEVVVLEKKRTVGANALRSQRVGNGSTVRGCVDRSLRHYWMCV